MKKGSNSNTSGGVRLFVRATLSVGSLAALCAGVLACSSAPRGPLYRVVPTTDIHSVEWYFDATSSMQGFVRPEGKSSYPYFIQTIESSVHNLYSPVNSPDHLHSFGLVAEGMQSIEEPNLPDFYKFRKGYENTDLSVVAERVDPRALTIIFTDFFQSDDHLEGFRAALLRKNLGTAFQFGLLSVKADFNGTVYDIPPAKSKLAYRGPRPVYAIVLGPADKVRSLLQEVLRIQGTSHIEALLLSSEIGQPAVPLRDLGRDPMQPNHFLTTELDQEDRGHTPLIENLKQGDTIPPYTRQLRLASAAKHPTVSLSTVVHLDPFEALPADPANTASWTPTVQIRVCSPGTRASPAGAERCPVRDILPSPPVFQVRAAPGGLLLSIGLDLGTRGDRRNELKIRSGTVDVVSLQVSPATNDLVMPAWVAAYSENRGEAFSAGRTPNLQEFLINMSRGIQNKQQPLLLDDYLYIDSN